MKLDGGIFDPGRHRGGSASYINNVTLGAGNSTIEVVPDSQTITLGSAATTVALGANNNLTIDTFGGDRATAGIVAQLAAGAIL